MGADAQPCADSFAFVTSSPRVVHQPPTHRVLVVISVRRDCCSWTCEASARVAYFTAPTSTSVQPARAGVDFVESRGAVLFEAGQQRAQLAVEVLPARSPEWKESRAFAVILQAPANASTTVRASSEIIVEPTPAPAPTVSASHTVVGILAVAGLAVLAACWLRVRRCRRGRAFQYKVLLLPRRDSGASEDSRESVAPCGGSLVKKREVRRPARRASSFRNWRAVTERRKSDGSDHVVPEVEGVHKGAIGTALDERENTSEDADGDNDPERDLRKHLASIQSTSPRR
ncbi:hypothetical protein PHYPSEUDO_010278 [Phytophthora pseudosyringae]|uniref:Calx-beta domain-containing protein n=1 Tax=Phytophthora pseudosyringae TaxID=221518 RepID=A0A8T1VDF3_9STRA|nr:hypothetical protein PHYPSEUDO_010278 [Phytophthora pseudosyringae]